MARCLISRATVCCWDILLLLVSLDLHRHIVFQRVRHTKERTALNIGSVLCQEVNFFMFQQVLSRSLLRKKGNQSGLLLPRVCTIGRNLEDREHTTQQITQILFNKTTFTLLITRICSVENGYSMVTSVVLYYGRSHDVAAPPLLQKLTNVNVECNSFEQFSCFSIRFKPYGVCSLFSC